MTNNTSNFFYRASAFTKKYLQVTFDSTTFLTPEEVLEMLGVEITEDVLSLIPEFTQFLKKHYVDYKEGCQSYPVCPNYIDFVIRFFQYELVEKPEIAKYRGKYL